MPQLRIAMIAPPWLQIPPRGYGGIEYALDVLVRELEKAGAEVTLFTIGRSEIPVSELKSLYDHENYEHIARPLYEVVSIPLAHHLYALDQIKNGSFDIIHGHDSMIGAAMMAHLDPASFPPVLHTVHNPFINEEYPKNEPGVQGFYEQLSARPQLFFNAISKAQASQAPSLLRRRGLPVVYNGVDIGSYPYEERKGAYFITLGRLTKNKAQAVAARLSAELGVELKMAGTINGISNPLQTLEALSESGSGNRNPDLEYYQREIAPLEKPGKIEYIGNVVGARKLRLISKAKALLFPIDWEEPFGMAVIEALACGTPVVAMNRGAMPELIEHGVNGYLANNEEEFKHYMQQVDAIDPAVCRETVERTFSGEQMAQNYITLYSLIISGDKTQNSSGQYSYSRLA